MAEKVETKKWWQSKIIIFNILITIGTAIESSLHIIADKFSPEIYFLLLITVPAVNVVLRFATNTGIGK